jgi:hypothetical protein
MDKKYEIKPAQHPMSYIGEWEDVDVYVVTTKGLKFAFRTISKEVAEKIMDALDLYETETLINPLENI